MQISGANFVRKSVVSCLAALGVLLGWLALSASPALATITHTYLSSITEASGPFSEPWGLAFDGSGNLFVADTSGRVVDAFDSSNAFVSQIGVGEFPEFYTRGVSASYATGDVYVAESGPEDIYVYKPEGGGKYSLLQKRKYSGFVYAAVNNSSGLYGGDVYVITEYGKIHVVKTNAAGELEEAGEQELSAGEEGFSLLGGPQTQGGLAVDGASGTLYVAEPGHGAVSEYDSDDVRQEAQLTGAETPAGSMLPTSVAIDELTGEVYVVDSAHNVIDEFSSAGEYLSQVTGISEAEPFAEPLGVAVQNFAGPTRGDVYVSDAGKVDIFAPDVGSIQRFALQVTKSGNGEGAVSGGGIDCGATCEAQIKEGATVTLRAEAEEGSTFTGWSGSACEGVVALTCKLTVTAETTVGAKFNVNVTTGSAATVQSTSASLTGHVDVAGGRETTSCQFEYGTDTSYGQTAPCSPSVPFASAQDVSASLSGLSSGVTYHYRLTASNVNGASDGQDRTFTTDSPAVSELSVTGVASEDATLHAQIENHDADATYRFEYGTAECGANACTAVPVPDADVPASNTPVSVVQGLHYLQPGVTYHYRIVAINTVGERASADHTFHTFAKAGVLQLPDDRAWELVSPVDKSGGGVAAVVSRTRAAADGNAVAFTSLAAFGDAAGMGTTAEYESVREGTPGTSGWSTHSILPKLEPIASNSFFTRERSLYTGEFSTDLTSGVLRTYTNLSGDPNLARVTNLYLRRDLQTPGEGSYQTLTACSICTSPLVFAHAPGLVGASENYDHVVFEAWARLTAEAPSEPEICVSEGRQCAPLLYEWDEGVVRYVGVLPSSEGGGPASVSIGARIFAGRPAMPNGSVSADGSRILFTVPEGNFGPAGPLYMRVDHSSTVKISASEQAGQPDPDASAVFQAASSDLSKIFFTSQSQLTDTPGGGLYLYDASKPEGDHLTLISPRPESVLGASTDGDYIYFITRELLLPGQEPFPSTAEFGVYLWHEGTISLVGSVANIDAYYEDVIGGELNGGGARVTPDGKHVAFTSHSGAGLTGYDQGEDVPSCEYQGCSEIYVYSAEAGGLQCASCNPSGAPATANASFTLSTRLGGVGDVPHVNHPLSDDGRYVFFTSGERLVPEDHNGTVPDVYEYDSVTGQVHLISSGRSNQPSFFLEASADGHDVFFTTFERLVGWDTDNANDLYDARIGGGFPPPARPVECEGDACSTPFAAPSDATPSSATFNGPGNQTSSNGVQPPQKPKKSAQRKSTGTHARKHKPHRKGHVRAKIKRAKHSHAGRTHR